MSDLHHNQDNMGIEAGHDGAQNAEPPFEPEFSTYVPNPAVVEKMEALVHQRKEFLAERERLANMPRTPYVRDEPRVGRNDPCPCGSGKKYKKCCMASE